MIPALYYGGVNSQTVYNLAKIMSYCTLFAISSFTELVIGIGQISQIPIVF